MTKTLTEIMEEARQAQQQHEQLHDVQLEVPGLVQSTKIKKEKDGK